MGLQKNLLSQAKRAFYARHHVFKTHPYCCNKTSTENKKSSWAYISLNHYLTHIKHFMSKFFCIENSPHLCRVKRPPTSPHTPHPHDDIRISKYIYLPTTMIWIIQKPTAVQLFYALRSKPDSVELSVWLQGFVQPCPLKLPKGWRA